MQIENTEQVGYRKGIVYALVCEETGDVYIGSTFNLERRKRQHKNSRNTCVSKEIIKRGNYYFEIIEEHYFPNKLELRKLEQNNIDKCLCINRYNAYTSSDEKIQYMKTYSKKYYQQNIEKFKDYDKNYYKQNAEKLKLSMKKYREQNAEKIKLSMKKYREKNAEKIKQWQNQPFQCECGGKYTMRNKLTHSKTKKHQQFVNAIKDS